MKRLEHLKFVIAAIAAFGALAIAPPQAAAQYDAEVDVSVFYDELDEGGDWFEHPEWGYVWRPPVGPDWRPYTRGRWIYTDDYGWYWDSQEPWAWAVYHYGRWSYDDYDGWIWIPGRRWGPAWVTWRYNDDNIGWAPLPPQSVWRPSVGIVFNVDFFSAAIYDPYWVFVQPRYFAYDRVYRYARPHRYNRRIIRQTRRANRYGYHKRRVVNRGIGPRTYRHLTRRSVPRRKLVVRTNRHPKGYREPHKRNYVELYRPGKRKAGYDRRKTPRKLSSRKWGRGGPPDRAAVPGRYKSGKRTSPYATNPPKRSGNGTKSRNTKFNNAPPKSGTPNGKRGRDNQFKDVNKGRRYDGPKRNKPGNANRSRNRNGGSDTGNGRRRPEPYNSQSDRKRSTKGKNSNRYRGAKARGSERKRAAKPRNGNGKRAKSSKGGGGGKRQAKKRDGDRNKKNAKN